MHWLIPVVLHSVSCLYGWLAESLTPAALALSVVFAIAQSFHPWGELYLLFAVFFLISNGAAIVLRYVGKGGYTGVKRTASNLVANGLVSALLVLMHHYYLKQRLSTVKWFILMHAPAGCLPVPSRTLAEPINFTFLDALANQLPWGIVASNAAAMASFLSKAVENDWKILSIQRSTAATLGALFIAYTAAYALPMCDGVDAAEQAMDSVDRSVAWHERTSPTWTEKARYQTLVGLITLIGPLGLVTEAIIGNLTQDQQAGKPISEKTNEVTRIGDAAPERSLKPNVSNKGNLVDFYRNLLVTSIVVFGMAIWSTIREQSGEDVSDLLPGLRDRILNFEI